VISVVVICLSQGTGGVVWKVRIQMGKAELETIPLCSLINYVSAPELIKSELLCNVKFRESRSPFG
jgi:hypothetical protein